MNWGFKNPEVRFFSRSLSLFLKGTCTLLLGQSCVLLPPLYLAMDLSYLFILSGQELNCSGFIWVKMLACNVWIHGRVWMEHVSNPVGLLLPMHFIVIMFKMNSPADERTKLKVIYCFKPFVSLICYVIHSFNCFRLTETVWTILNILMLKRVISSCRDQ